jgi:putative Mg2+ transporter-C (MgtC) family protein
LLPDVFDGFAADAGYLLLAMVLGGALGVQREAAGRAAGLRTHVLVCVAACLLTRIRFGVGDPGRIAGQIVSGVGFLGAGVIWRRGVAVRGLTTAATVWLVAAIGIATGAGGKYAALAALADLIALLTLTVGQRLENTIRRNEQTATIQIMLPRHRAAVTQVIAALTDAGAAVQSFESRETSSDQHALSIVVQFKTPITRDDLSEALLATLPDASFSWE